VDYLRERDARSKESSIPVAALAKMLAGAGHYASEPHVYTAVANLAQRRVVARSHRPRDMRVWLAEG
jgi:hypothetical protein